MMASGGIGIAIEVEDLEAVQRLITRLETIDEHHILTVVAKIGEDQTRRRIEEEKTAPDGTKWPPNREGTPTLLRTGEHLRDSIASDVSGSVAQWGSSWEFAHVHQNGAVIVPKGAEQLAFHVGGKLRFAKKVTIPKREFVGLSAENGEEIEEIITDYLAGVVGQ